MSFDKQDSVGSTEHELCPDCGKDHDAEAEQMLKTMQWLLNGREAGGIEAFPESPENNYIVMARAADYKPEFNLMWWKTKNKSTNRGLVCTKCKAPVVTSNGAWEVFSKAPRAESVLCGDCLQRGLRGEIDL